jgi:2-phosphoglycerate kinase
METPTKTKKSHKYKYNVIRIQEGTYPTPSSKYDFVKVKVWLEDHYYILSRFLVSRVLNVTKVDQGDAVKIALELKKRLVDKGNLNCTQAEMENQLFQILQTYGYADEYIYRYRMTTKFHHQRVPLIILITGTRCVGKSWLATQLAERLNLSTVLQTTLVYDLMYTIMKDLSPSVSSPFPPPSDIPFFYRDMDPQTLIEEYRKECKMIRHGIDTDVEKCFEEGKAIIIEGHNLDPDLFIELIEGRSIPPINPGTFKANTEIKESSENKEGKKKQKEGKEKKEGNEKEGKEKKQPKGIIIPFVLSMNARDHKLLIENWLSCSERDMHYVKRLGPDADSQADALLARLQLVQDYLCTRVPPFLKVDVNAQSLTETLDVLHSAVLDRIQQVYSGPETGFII